ncbi:MAG TPA: HAMP domain-containing sensor histidine kinase, partial [Cytophagaceae bacterium]
QKEEIEARNKKLEVLNEEKNYLIGVLSHDLKSPIHQIKGLATIFKLTSENLTEEQKETVEKIFQSTDRVTRMISEILDITAIESQTIEIKEEVVDLEPLCNEVLTAFKDVAEKKKINMCFEASGDTTIRGDKNYLLQVIENLVTNALKFSSEHRSIYVSINNKEGYVNLEVKDEGPGISAEDMKKLFGRFQKLSSKPTAGERSTGLGLSIVKKYVEAMNGKVWCESIEGSGATFIVRFSKA